MDARFFHVIKLSQCRRVYIVEVSACGITCGIDELDALHLVLYSEIPVLYVPDICLVDAEILQVVNVVWRVGYDPFVVQGSQILALHSLVGGRVQILLVYLSAIVNAKERVAPFQFEVIVMPVICIIDLESAAVAMIDVAENPDTVCLRLCKEYAAGGYLVRGMEHSLVVNRQEFMVPA